MSTATLRELSSALPSPSPAQIAAVFADADPNVFAERGRRVASARVITDTSRLYGLAASFWREATAEQKDLLIGFSPELLGVAVHQALELEARLEQFEAREQRDHTVREVTAAELGEVWSIALRRRDLAVRALAPIAGRDPAREAELSGATGTAESAESLARGLDALAALARRWIADPRLLELVRLTRLDAAWADRLAGVADTLRTAADAAMSRMTVRVTQGELDQLDGRNLHLLKLIVDVFDEAHDIDPAIPRLIPIAVANSFPNGKRSKKVATTSTSTASTPTSSTTGDATTAEN